MKYVNRTAVICAALFIIALGTVAVSAEIPNALNSNPGFAVRIPKAGCAPRTDTIQFLGTQHGEVPTWAGRSGVGVTELWGNADAGTFSVTYSTPTPGGIYTCLISSGVKWTDVRRKK
jgi:hypothetical protein